MPVCPNCLYEYVEGIAVCPDCNTPLVDELREDEWVVVFVSDKEYEIEMLKDNLESADITSTILSQKDSNFPAPGDLSVIKLLVKKEDMQAALNFIEEIKRNEDSGETD